MTTKTDAEYIAEIREALALLLPETAELPVDEAVEALIDTVGELRLARRRVTDDGVASNLAPRDKRIIVEALRHHATRTGFAEVIALQAVMELATGVVVVVDDTKPAEKSVGGDD